MASCDNFPVLPPSVLNPEDIDPIRINKDNQSFFIESSKDIGYADEHCLKIAIDRYFGGDPLNGDYRAEVFQQVEVHKGAEYEGSFRYRGRGSGKEDSVRLIIRTDDINGCKILSRVIAPSPDDSWKKISVRFIVPEDISTIELAIQFADCGVLEIDYGTLVDLRTDKDQLKNGSFEEGWKDWKESKSNKQVGSIWITNTRFIPWGVNYDRSILHGEDYIMEEMMELSPEKVDNDFRVARQCGANTIRFFLQISRFEPELKKQLDPIHLRYFDLLINLAKKHNLRIGVTGLSNIDEANIPTWFYENDEQMVDGEVYFWQQMARRYAKENMIFYFNLQNEPFITSEDTNVAVFGSFTMSGGRKFSYCHNHFLKISSLWANWVKSKYKTQSALEIAWDDFSSELESIDKPRLPNHIDNACETRLLDFQRLRLSLAEQWVSELSCAIRSEDQKRLVTLGFIPEFRGTGFVPERLSSYLDFICLHIYPQHKAKYTDSVTENLALSEIWMNFSQVGKPLVIEEWFALGEINLRPSEWFEIFLDHTLSYACGWISFYHILLEDREPNLIHKSIQNEWVECFIAKASEMHNKDLQPKRYKSSLKIDMSRILIDGLALDKLLKLFIKARESKEPIPKLVPDNTFIDKGMIEGWNFRNTLSDKPLNS